MGNKRDTTSVEPEMMSAEEARVDLADRSQLRQSAAPSRRLRRVLGWCLMGPSAWIVLTSALSLEGTRFEPSLRDWPLLPVVLCTSWLVLRARHDVSARSRDALLRVARTGGVAVVASSELWALAEIARYAEPARAHWLAAAGAVVALVAALSLALRARWLRRVRDGRVPGYRVRNLQDGDRVADAFIPALAYEPSDVLLRLCVTPGSYRGSTLEVPLARIPKRFWQQPPWLHLVI